MTGSGGYPVRRDLSVPSLTPPNTGSSGPSAQLRIRPDDDEHGRSRGAILPRFCKFVSPKEKEGAGKTGCTLHPRSRVQTCTNKNAHEHTGSAEAIRPSLRNGLRLISCSPRRDQACLSPSLPGSVSFLRA